MKTAPSDLDDEVTALHQPRRGSTGPALDVDDDEGEQHAVGEPAVNAQAHADKRRWRHSRRGGRGSLVLCRLSRGALLQRRAPLRAHVVLLDAPGHGLKPECPADAVAGVLLHKLPHALEPGVSLTKAPPVDGVDLLTTSRKLVMVCAVLLVRLSLAWA